jgi:hypothetical protein
MNYIDPSTVLSPKGSIEDLQIIYNGGEHSWSLARMTWDGTPVIGMRWNGGLTEGRIGIGNPQSRGYPTWFVVPNEVGEKIEEMLKARLVLPKPQAIT